MSNRVEVGGKISPQVQLQDTNDPQEPEQDGIADIFNMQQCLAGIDSTCKAPAPDRNAPHHTAIIECSIKTINRIPDLHNRYNLRILRAVNRYCKLSILEIRKKVGFLKYQFSGFSNILKLYMIITSVKIHIEVEGDKKYEYSRLRFVAVGGGGGALRI